MSEPLTVERHADSTGTRLRVGGELDVAGGGAVRAAMEQAAVERPPRVELDLRDVSFLDSSGLAAVLKGARALAANDIELQTWCPPGSEARLVIQLAGVGNLLGLS
jgi:anti-anti-sigma factor